MQNALNTPKTFQFSVTSQKIRSVLIDSVPWFIAKDVCEVLGHSNSKVAIKPLDEDEVRKVYLTDVLGRNQLTNAVSESGLYALIMRSNKSEARAFRKWVTGEVLPALRKSGYYGGRGAELGDFQDVRDVPYAYQEVNGYQVRVIPVDGDQWYSLGDLSTAIQTKTDVTQTAKRLNENRPLARKLWVYGATNPGWYVCHLGAQLLLSAARMLRVENQLLLDIKKEVGRD